MRISNVLGFTNWLSLEQLFPFFSFKTSLKTSYGIYAALIFFFLTINSLLQR